MLEGIHGLDQVNVRGSLLRSEVTISVRFGLEPPAQYGARNNAREGSEAG
jgi:hypothetical protein